MQQELTHRIRNNPKFAELVRKRTGFGIWLSIVITVAYFAFILAIAFAPKALGTPLAAGTVTTVGIPLGLALIVLSFVLTGVYVARANKEFDDLNRQIIEDTL